MTEKEALLYEINDILDTIIIPLTERPTNLAFDRGERYSLDYWYNVRNEVQLMTVNELKAVKIGMKIADTRGPNPADYYCNWF